MVIALPASTKKVGCAQKFSNAQHHSRDFHLGGSLLWCLDCMCACLVQWEQDPVQLHSVLVPVSWQIDQLVFQCLADLWSVSHHHEQTCVDIGRTLFAFGSSRSSFPNRLVLVLAVRSFGFSFGRSGLFRSRSHFVKSLQIQTEFAR